MKHLHPVYSQNEERKRYEKFKNTRNETCLPCHDGSFGSSDLPILRVEGMCPMAHFINVTCAVMLGPWYAFVCALAIGIIAWPAWASRLWH